MAVGAVTSDAIGRAIASKKATDAVKKGANEQESAEKNAADLAEINACEQSGMKWDTKTKSCVEKQQNNVSTAEPVLEDVPEETVADEELLEEETE